MSEQERRHLLLKYYRSLFPMQDLFRWLRYTRTREFSFTMGSGAYARYIVASRPEKLMEKVEKDVPDKIDIGAAYVHAPAISNKENKAIAKEIVFDVDLTDYKRSCCTGKGMCDACFPLIKCAVETLRYVLEKHLGMKKMLFVFSGGRGVHCWVSDPQALTTTARDRGNIVEYFSKLRKREICDKEIDSILLKYKGYTTAYNKEKPMLGKERKKDIDIDISLLYNEVFPILDDSVTKQTSHLLKSPFCIHPRTDRVCIPLLPEEVDCIKLGDIPTLETVLASPSILQKYTDFFSSYISSLWEHVS